jgi:hypothetical protein
MRPPVRQCRLTAKADDVGALPICSRVLLRLALLPGVPSRQMPTLAATALRLLGHLERTIDPPFKTDLRGARATSPMLPHRSHAAALASPAADVPAVQTWANCVRDLWRASMALSGKTYAWDALSARMLVLRVLAGDATGVEEWVRRQAISMLGEQAGAPSGSQAQHDLTDLVMGNGTADGSDSENLDEGSESESAESEEED